MVNPALASAYRFRRQSQTPRPSDKICAAKPSVKVGFALTAFALARNDVAAGVARYPREGIISAAAWQPRDPASRTSERLAYVSDPAAAGLRHVGDVESEPDFWRDRFWARGKASGWYADNESGAINGQCFAVVYQLPARKGVARFVAGYRFAEHDDGGATLDFGRIYEGERGDIAPPCETEAARAAGYAADSMAKAAAEAERDYQAAWAAGSRYSELAAEIASERQAALALLVERREVLKRDAAATGAFAAICGAIRDKVEASLSRIAAARRDRAKLAAGEFIRDWLPGFMANDARMREAFNEGAGDIVLI